MDEERLKNTFKRLQDEEDFDLFLDTVLEMRVLLNEFKYLSQQIYFLLGERIEVKQNYNSGLNSFIFSYIMTNGPKTVSEVRKYTADNFEPGFKHRAINDALSYLKVKGHLSYDRSTRKYTAINS